MKTNAHQPETFGWTLTGPRCCVPGQSVFPVIEVEMLIGFFNHFASEATDLIQKRLDLLIKK
jgi:hypothetical protein